MVLRSPKTPGWTDKACSGRDIGCIMQKFAPDCEIVNPSLVPKPEDHVFKVVPTIEEGSLKRQT